MQQAQGEGEENARREIRTRREILKKESDFKYFLVCRSCCRHKCINPLTLVVFVNNRYLTPGTFLEKKEKKKII